ncbi:M50 family metallopeptidase [Ktedonospora formicarum]|uniref:RIP metalloprotease RseP n=1 Tax=Ktedonospora formicarum TaxID=2778364 RepID=A0A8J3MPN3_9CHLR|nr:M50 family metallopeptidase [Ktedonospora formicarum]GHO43090.1 RIP metalloprotease RseP [Ktedonospora formicarum]
MWFGGRSEQLEDTQNPLTGASGGMSRSLAGEAQKSSTIYSLNLLPIGGFVRMPGEDGDARDEMGNYDSGSFAAKPAGKRIAVLCAGVIMNVLLAIVLFTVAYGQGEPTNPAIIAQVTPNSPASTAGMRADDKILSVNGQQVTQFQQVKDIVDKVAVQNKGKQTIPVELVVQRAGVSAPFHITVNALVSPPPDKGHLGVLGKTVYESIPLWQAPIKGFAQTFSVTGLFISTIGQMIVGAIQPQISGPVGIVKITGEVAQTVPTVGWWYILNLTAMLSINLAIVNILPFPALDGGRVVLILIEMIRGGKRLKPEREGLINLIGMGILLALMVVVTVSDVMHWGG